MGEKSGPPRWIVNVTAPIARGISGRRWFPLFAVMHHRGRKSGTAYDTPIAVVPTVTKDVFLIGLPWGRDTNWALNVIAAGGATLTWKGRVHSATEPRIIEAAEAAAIAKPFFRSAIRRFPAAIVLKRG
jgi:deazaflavin-dependent oxidoreductase (nitroreductase family)